MSELELWNPKGSLFSNTFERLFDDHFPSIFKTDGVFPDIEIKETRDNLILRAELPGMTKEDISVELKDSVLVLSGEKKFEQSEENEKFHRTEISYGKFSRSFHVPLNVDAEKVEAKFKDGVLTINIPKIEAEKPKKIDVV